jgi:hypothetical protein
MSSRYERTTAGFRGPELACTTLNPFLSFNAQHCYRARLQALDADPLSGLSAIPVLPVIQPTQGMINVLNHFPLSVTHKQCQVQFFFLSGSVIDIRKIRCFVFHLSDSPIDLGHQVLFPGIEDPPKVFCLLIAHVLLAELRNVWRNVARSKEKCSRHILVAVG